MKSFLHTGKLISLMAVFLLNAPWSAVQAYNHSNFKKQATQESVKKVDGFTAVALLVEEYSAGAEDEHLPSFNAACKSFPYTEIKNFRAAKEDLDFAEKTFDFRYNLKINLFPFHTFL